MLKVGDELKGLDVTFKLNDNERGILSSTVRGQGFDILQRIMEDQVRRFNFKLLDTNPSDDKQVLANHYLAKAVAQFYTALIKRLEEELTVEAWNSRKRDEVEPSVTEAVEEFS